MPFGPLITLILLVYALFLGVVMTFWFVLSPRREPEGEPRRAEETPAEQRRGAPGVYARPKNDEVRGANARGQGTSSSRGANAPTSTKRNDAFEDFIRSKNDDFDF